MAMTCGTQTALGSHLFDPCANFHEGYPKSLTNALITSLLYEILQKKLTA